MSLYRAELSPRAQAELRSITLWWRENRSNPELLDREVTMALTLLVTHPEAGPLFRRARRPGVRRLLLRDSQHHLYYDLDHSSKIVRVLAFWHTARKRTPRL